MAKFVLPAGNSTAREDAVAGQGDGSHRQPPTDAGKFILPAGNSTARGDTVGGQGDGSHRKPPIYSG